MSSKQTTSLLNLCFPGNATSSSGVESLMIVCLVVGAAVVILVVAVGVTLMVVMAKRKRSIAVFYSKNLFDAISSVVMGQFQGF